MQITIGKKENLNSEISDQDRDENTKARQISGLTEEFPYLSTEIESMKSKFIMEYYKDFLIKYTIYSSESCQIIYKSIMSVNSLRDLYDVESLMRFKPQRRNEQEARFLQSWLSIYDIPLPLNNFNMPSVWPTPLGDSRAHIANKLTHLSNILANWLNRGNSLSLVNPWPFI